MHYYERNIADIKEEYTNFLIFILSPLIFEGIKSLYAKAVEQEEKYIQMSKDNINVKNVGVFKIFQHFLKNMQTLNQNLIEAEMIRIRDASKHADIFEKLIKAVIKSNIILLTYNASGQQCKLVNEKLHEKIDCKIFIHKVYIESAKQFYNAPELFWHKLPPIEIKKNHRECIQMINKAIVVAVKESMPMNEILTEYLRNDYIVETENEKINRIKHMIDNNVEDRINYFDEEDQKVLVSEKERKILVTEEENNIHNNIDDNMDNNMQNNINDNMQNNINDIEELIGEKSKENNLEASPQINEEEFKHKLNNIDQNIFLNRQRGLPVKNQNQQNQPQNQNQQNENQPQNQNQQNNSDIENIDIVKNKLDDRTYFNAFFN